MESNGNYSDRDELGRFVPGHPGGPGRPRGWDFHDVCELQALLHGVNLEEAVFAVVQRLLSDAAKGNLDAAKFIIERFTGLPPKDPTALVQVNTALLPAPASQGPPVPEGLELADYLIGLHDAADDIYRAHDERMRSSSTQDTDTDGVVTPISHTEITGFGDE